MTRPRIPCTATATLQTRHSFRSSLVISMAAWRPVLPGTATRKRMAPPVKPSALSLTGLLLPTQRKAALREIATLSPVLRARETCQSPILAPRRNTTALSGRIEKRSGNLRRTEGVFLKAAHKFEGVTDGFVGQILRQVRGFWPVYPFSYEL